MVQSAPSSPSRLTLQVDEAVFPVAGSFTISRGSRTEIRVVTATLSDGSHHGQGECVPYPRYGETVEGVMAAIAAMRPQLEDGLDRASLQAAMKPGAARNALDSAFFDLEAKRSGRPVAEIAGLAPPRPLETAFTISLGTPAEMHAKAAAEAARPLLKVKLGGEGDVARIEAVRQAAPAARLIVDANEGWTVEQYLALAPIFRDRGVVLVEQPFPAGDDAALAAIVRSLPVCADESCHERASLAAIIGKYDAINVKLDKTGGLTEALALCAAARAAGLTVMVGCMLGTSLAMAPAFYAAQDADFVDLDAPLLIARDREPPIVYEGSMMQVPPKALWG